MRMVREWAEEYWAEVGVTLLIASALAVSVVLAVAFNIIVTRPASAEGASATGALVQRIDERLPVGLR